MVDVQHDPDGARRLVARWGDVLCGDHQQQILTGGWGRAHAHLARPDGLQDCGGCHEQLQRLGRDHDASRYRIAAPFADLPQQQELIALHEAAHAVTGEAVGMTVRDVRIAEEDCVVQGAASQFGGAVYWGDRRRPVDVESYAMMALAGMHSSVRWLRQRGLDTPANLLDAAFGGMGDVENIENRVGGEVPTGLFAHATGRADLWLALNGDAVDAVAQRLLGHPDHRLDGEQVRTTLTTLRDARRTAADDGLDLLGADLSPAPVPARTEPRPEQPVPAASIPGGSTAMSHVDDLRQSLAAVGERTQYMQGALAQVTTDAAEVRQTLAAAADGSTHELVEQATGALAQLDEIIAQAQGLLGAATDAAAQYAAQL